MKLIPRALTILDKNTCSQIHKKALDILRTKGFRVHSPQLRQRFKKAGAGVDDNREVVTLPAELVMEAVKSSIGAFTVYDLDGHPVRIAPGNALDTVTTYVEAIKWLDYGADRLRPTTLSDLQRSLVIADSMPLVKFTGIIVWPMDVPAKQQHGSSLYTILTTTRKPLIFGVQNVDAARQILDALHVAAPGRDIQKQPSCLFVSSPTSPLVLDHDSAETLIFLAERGQIPILAPCPMAGGTSQFALIGTVLQQVTENLFMLAAKHVINPELPVLWGGAAAAMDMRAGDVAYGGIERSLIMLANIDMADHYGLPCFSPAASVDSCLVDAQLGAEKAWTYLTRGLSRAAIGMGIGAVTNGKAVSLEQMLIDADIIGSVRRFTEGIETDHLDSAFREILEIEHGGNFLMSAATLELLHDGREYFFPATFNRKGTEAAPALKNAHDQAEAILARWKSPVPETIRSELAKLLKK